MKKKMRIWWKSIVPIVSGTMLLTGCDARSALKDSDLVLLMPDETYEKEEMEYYQLVEDKDSLYEEEPGVKVLYMTVGQGSDKDGTNHTLKELHSKELTWFDEEEIDPYKCEAVVQFGNEEGPVLGMFGYGITSANATVALSGYRASTRPQKSYKVKIKGGEGNVNGMKTLILSKSFSDPLRITNKLCYELMREIPELLSTRTSFVHLYIKDVTEERDTKFVDYGLYTMVEPINKKYLENRGLDKSGELYKAIDFDWQRHVDVIMQPTDGRYDKKQFEKLLESKGSNDYSKLLTVLDKVNDESIPIEDTVEQYFDEDNLYTFMAFNILMNNQDTDTENYYIYSPVGTNKLYLIAWDNDGALRNDYELLKDSTYDPGWKKGAFLFHQSVFFQRILKSEACVNQLSEKIDQLYHGTLAPKHVAAKADELASVAKEYIYALPDMSYARVTSDNYDVLLNKLGLQIEQNYYSYYDSIEGPWPFHIGEVKRDGENIAVTWEHSFALGMDVTYHVQVARDWTFDSPVADEDGLTQNTLVIGNLRPGQYFLRITSVSSNGHEMGASEYYNTEKKTTVNNTLCFYVFEDGSVAKSTFR